MVCIVDGGHPDMKRKLDNVKEIAHSDRHARRRERRLLHGARVSPGGRRESEDQIAEELAKEATANRFGAFGEIGENPNGRNERRLEQKVFRAVGKAHLRTNLPIFTHNAYGTGPNVPKEAGLHQLDVLESVGVKPEHIVIGHCDSLVDPSADMIKAVAKRGAWVGFDRTGGQPAADEQESARFWLSSTPATRIDCCCPPIHTGGRTLDSRRTAG